MIHSKIKWLHTEKDTTTKQKTTRSHNTIYKKDCRDLTIINCQRKHEGFDRSLPKVKLCCNRLKGQCCSLPKKRKREAVVRSRPKVKPEQEGEVSCGKNCEEVLSKVKLEQEGEESWEGRLGCKQKIRGARSVEVKGCACCPGLTRACWSRRGHSLRQDRRGV